MPKNTYSCFIYIALPCEAKSLIEHFGLKKDLSVDIFTVFCNDDLCLVITGVGKTAMAAAVAYTQALFAADSPCILLNIGIAGHKHYSVGELFLIDKINDVDSGKNYYPPIVFKPACARAALQTASKPVLNYHDTDLCDMEASAFYETASRFNTGELIHCLKIISDNALSPVSTIQPQQVSELIASHIPTIAKLLVELQRLAQEITPPQSELFLQLTQRYRFTVSEKIQLKSQLIRWQALTERQPLIINDTALHNGKAILQWLKQKNNSLLDK